METNYNLLKNNSHSLLTSLSGDSIESTYLIEDVDNSLIHPASPLILITSRIQLELWSVYLNEFSLSANEIDLGNPPFYWLDNYSSESNNRWLENPLSVLRDIIGKTITSSYLISNGEVCNGIAISLNNGKFIAINDFDNFVFRYITNEKVVEEEI